MPSIKVLSVMLWLNVGDYKLSRLVCLVCQLLQVKNLLVEMEATNNQHV